MELSPLTPDTLYNYRVEDRNGKLYGESTFRTAPLPASRTVHFVAVSDTGVVDEEEGTFVGELEDLIGNGRPRGRVGRVVGGISRLDPQPELLLHSGDVLHGSGKRRYYRDAFFRPFARLIDHIPIFPVIGNHDSHTKKAAPWLSAFTTPANNSEGSERYYSFDWGDVHFVALDVYTSPFDSGSAQRRFLEEDLARTTLTWKVVFFHRSPLTQVKGVDGEQIKTELVPIFEANHVDLVLTGNDHCYQRFHPVSGVTYIVLGSGGAKPRGFRPAERLAKGITGYQFLRCSADASELKIETVRPSGEILDSVTLVAE